MCTHAGGYALREKQREKKIEAVHWKLEGVQGPVGLLQCVPWMPLTTLFGFLLSLASVILFVANIYNSAQAQPAKCTFQLSVCLVKPQAQFTRVAGIIYLFIAVVSRRLLSDK